MSSSSSPSTFEYLVVERRRKKRTRTKNNEVIVEQRTPFELLARTQSVLESESQWVELYQKFMNECVRRLVDAKYWTLSGEIICLGLGSPSSSRDARAQLVFLLRLKDDLNIPNAKIRIYDPIFTPEDKDLLGIHLGLTVIKSDATSVIDNHNRPDNITGTDDPGSSQHSPLLINEPISTPTIAYMPHCEIPLYESFLRKNWTRDRLSRITLIANNLEDYITSTPHRTMSEQYPCILRLAPYLSSHCIPTSSSHTTAFANISMQCVNVLALPQVDTPFWNDI